MKDSEEHSLNHVNSDKTRSMRRKERNAGTGRMSRLGATHTTDLLILMRHFKQRLTFLFTECYTPPKYDMIRHGGTLILKLQGVFVGFVFTLVMAL